MVNEDPQDVYKPVVDRDMALISCKNNSLECFLSESENPGTTLIDPYALKTHKKAVDLAMRLARR